ncbi:HEAT repeats family protein [Lyngbya aestuarii BL J]|uniref:HEAT repeats family protein n=1 Tax=Lyngbya aestuarii BL J TaxID=1348334 RepID=U7QT76_9CYAN|nr:DUF1822 family protein [Lyngbya aestuarii]ERT09626.1 HEAT repeats family protein [Lyngbya aestuarii BL J]
MISQFMQTLDDFSIPLFIPSQAKSLAEQFAAQQPTPQKATQVYLNTLAVCIVNNYLRIMGIPTNLTTGDSWNPSVRLYADVADLEVVGRGRLECRPIQVPEDLNSTACSVPGEVQSDRIGYVIVELDLEQELATLLGFVETANDSISLRQLRSPDELLEHLLSSPQAETVPTSVNLRQWLQNTVTTGWETVETLLSPAEPSFAVRGGETAVIENPDSVASVIRLLDPDQSEEVRAQAAGDLGYMGVSNSTTINALTELLATAEDEETRWQAALSLGKLDPNHPQAGIRRVRAINLTSKPNSEQVALMVAIMPKANDRIGVWLQVEPLGSLTVLPGGLALRVLSMSGETRLQVEARSDRQGSGLDRTIGRRFSPPPETGFQVQLQFGSMIVTEDFLA